MTKIIQYPWSNEQEQELIKNFSKGCTLAFPTETFYALGGNALDQEVHRKVFSIKKRPSNKPLLLLVDNNWFFKLAEKPSAKVIKLIDAFWPGPLTLIVKAKKEVSDFLTDQNHAIAMRYSNSHVVQKMISILNSPLIGTSANLTNYPAIDHPENVLTQLSDFVDILIDGGKTPGHKPSTILNTTIDPFYIERHGVISEDVIQKVL